MLIVGIDPGTNLCGWAIIDTVTKTCEDHGVIETPAKATREEKFVEVLTNLDNILRDIKVLAMEEYDEYEVKVAIEDQYMGLNPKTMGVLKELCGGIKWACTKRRISTTSYPATTVKKTATGSGKASKEQVVRSMQALYNLKHTPSEDEADALAIATTHMRLTE